MEKLFLPWAQDQFLHGLHLEGLNPQPRPLKGLPESRRTIFQPGGQVFSCLPHAIERGIVRWPIFPVIFIHRKDVMGVEPSPIELPQSKSPTGAAVAIGERMDGFEPVMQDGRTE